MRAALRYFVERVASYPEYGLPDSAVQAVGSIQERFDMVVSHYLADSISLGRAAELLGIAAIDLRNRLNRLNIVPAVGPVDRDDVRAEVDAALQWKP
jgi:predicted HTH domain antitoxin